MSQPRVETILLTRGDDFAATFTFDVAVSNFTEMRFTIRDSWATTEADNSTAMLSVTLTATGTYTADLALTNLQTRALAADSYVYDLQVTTTAGAKKYTAQRGPLKVGPDVSR